MKCPRCNGLLNTQPGGKTYAVVKFYSDKYQCIICARIFEAEEIERREQSKKRLLNSKTRTA